MMAQITEPKEYPAIYVYPADHGGAHCHIKLTERSQDAQVFIYNDGFSCREALPPPAIKAVRWYKDSIIAKLNELNHPALTNCPAGTANYVPWEK